MRLNENISFIVPFSSEDDDLDKVSLVLSESQPPWFGGAPLEDG